METVIFESTNRTILPLIEQALTDSKIPYLVTGASDIGIIDHVVKIRVPNEFSEKAKEIVNQIV